MAEDELGLPKATVGNFVKALLPPNVKLGSDARQLIVECCTEFVQMVGTEANEICTEGKKRVISPEHVLSALEALELPQYVETARTAMEGHKEEAKNVKKKRASAKSSELSKEELQRKQEELLEKAMLQYQRSVSAQTISSDANAFSSEPSVETGAAAAEAGSASQAPADPTS